MLAPACAPVRGSALCPHSLSCSEMRLSLPSSWATGWPPSRVSCTGKASSPTSVGCWASGISPGFLAPICTGTGVSGRQLHPPPLQPRLQAPATLLCRAGPHPVQVPPVSASASSIAGLPQPLSCPSWAALRQPPALLPCRATAPALLPSAAGTSLAVPRRDPNPLLEEGSGQTHLLLCPSPGIWMERWTEKATVRGECSCPALP